MTKKIFILIFLLIIIALGALLYFLLKSDAPVAQTLRDFVPFGINTTNIDNQPSVTTTEPQELFPENNTPTSIPTEQVSEIPRFRKIADGPVAGFTIINTPITETVEGKKVTKNRTAIRYAERATGHVFQTFTDSLSTNRLTNTTLVRIQEALFTNNGNTVILRSLDETDRIKTYLGDIVANTSTSTDTAIGSLRGDYIDDNISFISVSPDTQSIFVLRKNTSGATGFTADAKAGKSKLIFSSKISEWVPQWTNKDNILLTTSASGGVPGLSITLNSTTGAQNRIMSGVNGLTSLLNYSGTRLLYSSSNTTGGISLFAYNTKTGTSTTMTRGTLPEKCVWSRKQESTAYCFISQGIQSGLYPDEWYQGAKGFIDTIWQINTETNTPVILFQPTSAQIAVDAIHPALNTNEDHIFFIDKISGSLWSYRLTN